MYVDGAFSRPFKLSMKFGGLALLSMIAVSRVGLSEHLRSEETWQGVGLNVFRAFSASAVLPICDAL